MNARDVMTADVVSVPPDAPTELIARLLLEHCIRRSPAIKTQRLSGQWY